MDCFPQIYPQACRRDIHRQSAAARENLKYFLLDWQKYGCRMSLQSRLLTGVLTGPGRGERSGDASIRELRNTESEAIDALDRSRKAWLAGSAETRDPGRPDKNGKTHTGKEPPGWSESRLLAKAGRPRCRERNRRWRKSHHNKNLTACRIEREGAKCESRVEVLTGIGSPLNDVRYTKNGGE